MSPEYRVILERMRSPAGVVRLAVEAAPPKNCPPSRCVRNAYRLSAWSATHRVDACSGGERHFRGHPDCRCSGVHRGATGGRVSGNCALPPVGPNASRRTPSVVIPHSTVARLATVEKCLDERPSSRTRPVARSRHAADQSPLAVDEVGGGRPPHAVGFACHVTALVEKDGRHVAALAHHLANVVELLTEIHQQDLQPLTLELAVYPVDGR